MSAEVYRRAPGVSSRVIDGRAVIVVMPKETLHSLNASGTFLWKAIDGTGRDRASLREALVERYALDAESAEADVGRFLDQLSELGAIEATHG